MSVGPGSDLISGAGMDLTSLMGGVGGLDMTSLDPSLALPNHCCAHGSLHCTVAPAGFNPDPALGLVSSTSSLPPIEQQQMVGSAGLYDLTAARTPHGGIKPVKVLPVTL